MIGTLYEAPGRAWLSGARSTRDAILDADLVAYNARGISFTKRLGRLYPGRKTNRILARERWVRRAQRHCERTRGAL